MEKLMYKLDTRESRYDFIRNNKSSIYSGTNEDGEEVIVFLQQNEGMEIWTKHHAKPMWYEVVYYDSEGWSEGVSYKPTSKLEKIMEERREKNV